MAEKRVEKCARPGCNCPAAKGSKYCRPHWESVPINHLPDACECGHAECAVGETVGAGGIAPAQRHRNPSRYAHWYAHDLHGLIGTEWYALQLTN